MVSTPNEHFAPDPKLLAVLAECIDSYGIGDLNAEWPNNILSRRTIVYGSGAIARRGDTIHHAVEPEELAICRRLSSEAAELMRGVEIGMGSASSDEFRPFYIAANFDEPIPHGITPEMIREKFRGTIFPLATITVEPLAERGRWWAAVESDGSECGAEYFRPWREMIHWFAQRSEFIDRVFVRIGDQELLGDLPREQLPVGTELTGCVLPRLALGLTKRGSLAGLFGFTVKS